MGEGAKNVRALVLGGAGPVGASICARLLALGYELYCIDSEVFSPTPTHYRNQTNQKFKYLRADLTQLSHEKLVHFAPACDVVLNFCGPARFSYYTTHPEDTATTHLKSTLASLQYCRAVGSRFILASSSEVYGSGASKDDRMDEARPTKLWSSSKRSIYASAKLLAESLTIGSETPWVILRLFNVYGPDYSPDDDRVIPKMIASIDAGRHFTVFGDGSQVRSFIFIDDLVDAVVLVLESTCKHQVFNVGNPEAISILDLGRAVSKEIGKPFLFEEYWDEVDDILYRVPQIEKMNQSFGWRPKVPLRLGLERCVNERE